jgi:plastocyanin
MRFVTTSVIGAALVLGLAGCGSDSSTPSGTGGTSGCTLANSATVTIGSTGLSPKDVCVTPGSIVTFSNADTVAHSLAPDAATGCSLLAIGPIAAGRSTPVTFPVALACTYHDVANASATAFQGSVSVASPGTPGY